jgi:hypothetical protein
MSIRVPNRARREIERKRLLWRRDASRANIVGDDMAEEDGDFSEKISHLDKPMTIWKVAE